MSIKKETPDNVKAYSRMVEYEMAIERHEREEEILKEIYKDSVKKGGEH